MFKPKKILSVLLCALAITPAFAIGAKTENADAATFNSINSASVFVKQQESDTCTLASNVMLLRRAALMKGDSDWQSITESSCRSTLWCGGMRFDYTYRGIHVTCERVQGDTVTCLRNLLAKHPEGIVAYDYDYPHAILLTDYTNGRFYCSDPARCVASGRVDASEAIIDVSGVEAYWYVDSYLPDLAESNVKNNSTVSGTTVNVGDKITFNGSASGGLGNYKFTYSYKKGDSSSWVTVGRADTSETSASFVPQCNGKYTLKISVKDSDGTVKDKTFTVTVNKYPELRNNSTLSSQAVILGSNLVIRASASGGAGNYTYTYYYKRTANTKWEKTGAADTTSTTATIKPLAATAYDVKVVVKDKDNNKAEKNLSFEVCKPVVNYSSISDTSVVFGNDVNVTLGASGGTGMYIYEINVLKPSGSSYVNVKKYGSAQTYKYHPWEAGTYKLQINAKDSAGNVNTKYLSFKVRAAALQNNSLLDTLSLVYGESVNISFAAAGGTKGYQYEVEALKPSSESWIKLRSYASGTSYTYRPWEYGTYKIRLNAKDSSGTVSSKNYFLSVSKAEMINVSVADKTTVAYGSNITLTLGAKYGEGTVQYEINASKPSSGQWINLRKYSTSSSYTYHPWEKGTYKLQIVAKDSQGNTSAKLLTFKVE